MLGAHPLKATATGGRNVLTHFGDCWDNYQVDFTYPNDVHFSFASTQFGTDNVVRRRPQAVRRQRIGDLSLLRPHRDYRRNAWACQDSEPTAPGSGKFAANGAFLDNLEFADRDKERTFIASIVSGPAHNQIAEGVERR